MKSLMLFTGKNFEFSDFTWKKLFLLQIIFALANKQLQYTDCPKSHEVKATRQ